MEKRTYEPLVLKEKEARTLLNMGRSEYYKKIETGEIRAVRRGRLILVPRDAIYEYNNSLPPASKVARDDNNA